MAKSPEIVLDWADGSYLFALRGKQIEELEAVCINPATGKGGIGIAAIGLRVMGWAWHGSDLRHVIRLGLIGGGMGAVAAERMCRTYVDDVPLSGAMGEVTPDSPLAVAIAVLTAAFAGVDKQDEAPGETEAPKT